MIYLLFILTSSICYIIYSNTFIEYVLEWRLFSFYLVFEYVGFDEFIFGFVVGFMVDWLSQNTVISFSSTMSISSMIVLI